MGNSWNKLFEIFKSNKKLEWSMIDSTYVKVYQHSCGAHGENQAIPETKGGLIMKKAVSFQNI